MTSTTQPLAGKVALITGASKGIGAATALELASLGARVAINYSSDAKPAEELVAKIGSADKAIAIKANAGDVKELERLVQETVAWSGGKIDILIPNAGIALMRNVEQTTEEDFQRTYDLNVKGPYFLVQKALPYLPKGAHVVLLSTSLCASSTITPNYLLYVTSKGAVEQMTRVLAKDLGTKGINVNAIAPGPMATDLFFQGKSQELVDTIASGNPFKRLGQPSEIAKAIAYLSGEGGSWVNGQILRVNGGMTVGN
ncbi:NAD(P)-binding protein [Cucurbitaria berberidis CBS 394.84]|uniref:NAD(P)-binding protein n=1 Tax=Cucurbitaria berberidis CBS 394.84 TaxID=1168544 RepID=A0A9P4L9D5_9PLEO|nr:NAD(P)-binding protein [Cucurbitaria berberidis CBS 394.84]KAF1846323.1 NAD(P)-binding protein [Cucurbitaria berberidis CBS 394.84]